MRLHKYLCIALMMGLSVCSFAQREQEIVLTADSIRFDTLSIVPASFSLSVENQIVKSDAYILVSAQAVLRIVDKKLVGKTATIRYTTLQTDLSEPYYRKDVKLVTDPGAGVFNPFKFKVVSKASDKVFSFGNVNRAGSISRGISFGNAQSLSVNSNLNLQLSGKLSENISVLASVTDDNIPIQPEGNTQQLQDFDQVFIQVYTDRSKLIAGDFQLRNLRNSYLKFYKRAQGGYFSHTFRAADSLTRVKSIVSAAVSKGKFARNVINGIEGNQGPYRLTGNENESFIIVLSGTERVYLDGKLLKRGQSYDYTIDYNTAELTFTASQIITQFSRIIVEFQYADKNYARSLLYTGHEFKRNKTTFDLQFYGEQDAKNQPLQLELNDAQKGLLGQVGDSIQNALFSTLDSIDFQDDLVMYKMIDSTVSSILYDSVLVFSTNPDSAYYRASFALVGSNNGDYVQVNSLANGKVYQWVAPIGGIPQGNYAPVTLLPSPKTRQMLTGAIRQAIGKQGSLKLEGALSNFDQNNFSSRNDADNIGHTVKLNYRNIQKIAGDSLKKWTLTTDIEAEQLSHKFREIERFRSVEFFRNWNVRGVNLNDDQYLGNVKLGLNQGKRYRLNYRYGYYQSGTEFTGNAHAGSLAINQKGFRLTSKGRYMTSIGNAITNSEVTAFSGDVSQQVGAVVTGFFYEQESNTLQLDSALGLLNNSFNYEKYGAYVRTKDTLKNPLMIKYSQRKDKGPLNNELKPATLANNIDFLADLNSNPSNRLRIKGTYRQLDILDTLVTGDAPENTVIGRLDHSLRIKRGFISAITYYEIGSGLESKREFSFIEVNPGQGTHQWIDYNSNGIKEISEFEIAAFQDQATYIKVFTPTNQYVKTFTNQFNEVFFLKPEVLWGGKKGFRKTLSRFSNKTAFRVDRKTNDGSRYYDPFLSPVLDTSLVSTNSSLQNTLYLNRLDPVFGMEWVFQEIKNKTLLVNGYESRTNTFNAVRMRWNLTRKLLLRSEYKVGARSARSEFIATRNYAYDFEEVLPEFQFQPGVKFRTSIKYSYKQKINRPEFGNETAFINDLGAEIRYNMLGKGNFLVGANFIDIKYNGVASSTLGFEMLEGLQPGFNYTWNISFQRSLNKNLQLTLNYNGRASEGASVVHVGGAQLRAFF